MITRDLHVNLKCFIFLGRFEESMNKKNRDNDISRKTTEKYANMYQPDFEAKLLICSYKYIFYAALLRRPGAKIRQENDII